MAEEPALSPIVLDVMQHWSLTPLENLSRRVNEHWLVQSGEHRLVLRGYAAQSFGDIQYEIAVLRRLHALGWPVPVTVEEPLVRGGRTWCLFTWLPGVSRPADADERRARGRLLAELHGSTAQLTDLGQREGFSCSDELISDLELTACLRAYECIYPREGHIMRWHLEQAQQTFARLGKNTAPILVLHGDFAPWNLLFEGEQLTGILDFEGSHLNYRVADFALSWRGEYDEIIDGYQEVTRLTEPEIELIIPAYWSWLFLGVKQELAAMLAGQALMHEFKWQVDHLLRRSKLLGSRTPAYREAR